MSQVPDPVFEAGQRARMTVKQHVAWLEQRRVAGVVVGEQVTFPLHPDLERIFGPGATRLALEFQASVPVEQPVEVESEHMEGDSFDWSDDLGGSESGDMGDQIHLQEGLKASSPKPQRGKRPKRKKRESSGSNASRESESNSDFKAGDVMDLMTLGSSFITSGSDDNSTVAMGNEKKKPRLEDQEFVVEGLGGGMLVDTGVQPAVLQEQGRGQDVLHEANLDCDLAAGKVDNSSEGDELSSGVTGDILSPGSSRGEDSGEV